MLTTETISNGGSIVNVEGLQEEAAIQFLQSFYSRLTIADAQKIAEACDGMPLILHLAGDALASGSTTAQVKGSYFTLCCQRHHVQAWFTTEYPSKGPFGAKTRVYLQPGHPMHCSNM